MTRLIVSYLRDWLAQGSPAPCGFTVTAGPRRLAALAEETLGAGWDRQVISAELTQLDQLAASSRSACKRPNPRRPPRPAQCPPRSLQRR
ncbi:hypothetical protein ACQPYK_29530 [Streptosporangium sp. CA-135522]|uniref:hypothetical protein n=1 Tax=Streptosporangium sp. CA-135522 TaxID=3240072 RepID=UPI003D90EF79